VLQFSSISFDIAVEELFPAWAVGATVVSRGPDDMLGPSEFTRWIGRQRITVLDLPTAYWHAWVDALALRGESPPESLRLVIVGGEKASPRALARWQEIARGRIRWMNSYGPTETTVIATVYEPHREDEVPTHVPIGRPIANTRIYLLDRRLVPPGHPGEVYIGGAGVARGYRNRPVLTAERFVPDPFGSQPGSRLFRTGDLARWREDGTLEFLGRRDHQVKIGGFRVDPGEVESALRAQPAVRDAVVVVRSSDESEARLAAYVVPHPQHVFSPGELRHALRATLPRYMVPTSFTRLAALPLTPSGKVDRNALQAPDRVEAELDDGSTAPRDPLEAQLAALWAEVLGVREVGVRDNFFDLGGSSLLAIRLLSRIEGRLGVALPLSALFFAATVEELAGLLRARAEGPGMSPLVAIQPRGAKSPFVCVHPAGGIVYCFQELARHLGTDRPFFGIQAPGLDGDGAPLDRVEAMAAHYVAALRQVQPEGPYHLGGWSMGGLVAYEMACQLRDAGQHVATLALLDTQAPPAPGGPDPAMRELAHQLASLARGTELFAPFGGDPYDRRRDLDNLADAALLVEMARDLAAGFGGDPQRLFDHLRGLAPADQRDFVLRHFQLHEVYALETGPERVQRLWEVLRASMGAAARYLARPYPGRAVVFRASARPNARTVDSALGWRSLAEGGVTIHVIPGDHASILRPPAVAALAAVLGAELDAGDREEAGRS
jgi:aspartate racemase